MKNTIIAGISLALSLTAIAQESFTIKQNTKVEGLPAEYAAYGEQDIVSYIKGDKSRTEITSMMFNTTVFSDGKVYTMLMDLMGNKSGYKATREEMDAENVVKKADKPKIEYTSEKKTIAGYECSKVIMTSLDKDKKETKSYIWVTDKIKANNSMRGNNRGMMDLSELKGYPLGMEMASSMQGQDIKVAIMATEVLTTPLDDKIFIPETTGYTLTSYKEFLAKQKSMGR
jgi:hypothetical protein